jgi:hypothetical protein
LKEKQSMKSEILQPTQPKTALDAPEPTIPLPSASEPTLGQDIASLLRYGLYAVRARLGTRGLIILAAAMVAAGLALNWSWVVAIGLAPILLAALPCAAMCALGLCMMPKRDASSREDGGSTSVSGPNKRSDDDAA